MDLKTGTLEKFTAFFYARAFKTDNERDLKLNLAGGLDHTLGDHIAFHDTAEDVEEDRAHPFVLKNDLEAFADLVGRSATADVQKIGRHTPGELDHIHGRHRQSGAVHKT